MVKVLLSLELPGLRLGIRLWRCLTETKQVTELLCGSHMLYSHDCKKLFAVKSCKLLWVQFFAIGTNQCCYFKSHRTVIFLFGKNGKLASLRDCQPRHPCRPKTCQSDILQGFCRVKQCYILNTLVTCEVEPRGEQIFMKQPTRE